MGPDATAPPTRRELRERATSEQPIVDGSSADEPGEQSAERILDEAPAAIVTSQPGRFVALAWVDDNRVAAPDSPSSLAVSAPSTKPGADLLATAPRRSPWRPGVLVPLAVLIVVIGAYVATTLLWPLYAVEPEIEAFSVQPAAAAVVAPAWPADGGAAITVAGAGSILSSSSESESIASITKIVTALVVLDEMPLALGEAGPDYAFTAADRRQYQADRAAGESALDVPVGGTLTQYQMLEGLLVGSANNYADRLSGDLFPSDEVFADAARAWLSAHGISGISIDDPSGIVAGNAATPEALIPLAVAALENPVIAEIVAKPVIDLPGAGRVENTNDLLNDPGVVGLKTGTLDSYNLLAAKNITVGDTTVRVYGSVLGQPDRATRDAAMRTLFAQAEADLQPQPSVPAGTRVGEAVTEWGESVDVVTSDDAVVVLWNGAAATPTTEYTLGDAVDEGATVGTLTVASAVDTDTVELRLTGEIEPPTAWWRLTHPLELFGLAG
ncbi:D-alanyl-D-alanine carboxypeptidase family protein [Microbacterium sp. P06]|uniref:D-alanyl-D-alanine carboxypeptidase family protein n=1 Tax=Microbacterium sp. P06 TaxID=3366949 RepID=UPI0037470B63